MTKPTVRSSILIVLIACACTSVPRDPVSPDISSDARTESKLLGRAIAAMGGDSALARVHTLSWRGEAAVYVNDSRIDLSVDTTVRPFEYAHSMTWRRDQDRTTQRVLEIDGAGGWMTRDDVRSPLPESVVRHERQQYALYGLMLLIPLRAPDVTLTALPPDADGHAGLRAAGPRMPTTDLYFDAAAQLVRMRNRVDGPEGGTIDQQIDLSGEIVHAGVRWSSELRIRQNGRPYFELHLAHFEINPERGQKR